ncbi:Oidioi.mRNA.OKI2018_I69.XSR.g13517.t1.cds [Oikopleura dioica]|uniref:Oidioi.mRNA.OKI2018_I69.XSR.g13517.t1.cds n=1 Tax=Oikopleura dioica TaxID=34765 RepID=A0ABN7SFK5_OIKDI|nr:Oidioi.mRNA.OKI2018_I69.XSR.g13517.t1.cds [Oikopleura dioica]
MLSLRQEESLNSRDSVDSDNAPEAAIADEPRMAQSEEPKASKTSLKLEILKSLIWDIQNSLNTNAAVPPKRIACYGETVAEKMSNLVKEAIKIISESQEASNQVRKILTQMEEEETEAAEAIEAFQAIATISHATSIKINRRLASTNKIEIEELQNMLQNKVRPIVENLMKQVHKSQVFCSKELVFWAKMMEPSEQDSVCSEQLLKLEEAVTWILEKLWSQSAAAILRMALAKCEKPASMTSKTSPRFVMLTHIWNLRFKQILKRQESDREAAFTNEQQIAAAISRAIFGDILFQITNTRCIFPRLLASAARSAWTHLNSMIGESNPISCILKTFLANIDSNPSFTAWDAILSLRKIWPNRDSIPEAEYKILNLGGIDDRIERGIAYPASLKGTTYEKLFWRIPIPRSFEYNGFYGRGSKRKREDEEASDMGEHQGRNGGISS